jgi:hypothetical protein
MPWTRKRSSLAIAALLALCAATAPAGAVDAAKPAPCTGMFATDAAGDAITPGGISGTEGEGQPNMDLTGFFFNYRADKDGKTVLTANMVLKNLDKTVPDPYVVSGGINYYFHWSSGGESRFVKAENPSGDTITYGYGTVNEEGVYTTDGETTGAFFDGPDGVVQIDVPAEWNGKPGEKLEKVLAVVDTIEGQDDFFGFNNHADSAGHAAEEDASVTTPNGQSDYTVTVCPAGAAPPAGGETPPPSGGTTPPPSGGGSTPAPAAAAGPLELKVPKTLGSAKKAKKKKSLVFKVTAREAIANLKIALKPAKGPAVAQATIKSLKAGTSKIKLKASKKLKKGKYLFAAQVEVNGQVRSMSVRVAVKK